MPVLPMVFTGDGSVGVRLGSLKNTGSLSPGSFLCDGGQGMASLLASLSLPAVCR